MTNRVELEWIAAIDGDTLCASGRPIRIRRIHHDIFPFRLEADGHAVLAFGSLGHAKMVARQWAAEMDEFVPVGDEP